MKKIIIIALLPLMSFAQGVFDKLEDLDDVTSIVVTKDAFELLRKFPDADSEDMEIFNTAKGLESLKVFTTENQNIASKMEEMVSSSVKSLKLTELMRVKDKKSKVKIYVKSTKNKELVSKVLMFIKNRDNKGKKESVIVSLLGEIDINKLSSIADNYSNRKK